MKTWDNETIDEESINYLKESHVSSPINAIFIKKQVFTSVESLKKYVEDNQVMIEKPKSEQEILF